jgi:hypothetical protein
MSEYSDTVGEKDIQQAVLRYQQFLVAKAEENALAMFAAFEEWYDSMLPLHGEQLEETHRRMKKVDASELFG